MAKKDAKVNASQIGTRVRIRVAATTTKEEAVALRERLTDQYEKYMDELADNDIYSALTRLLETCGVTGDFHVDRPDFEIWIADKQIA